MSSKLSKISSQLSFPGIESQSITEWIMFTVSVLDAYCSWLSKARILPYGTVVIVWPADGARFGQTRFAIAKKLCSTLASL